MLNSIQLVKLWADQGQERIKIPTEFVEIFAFDNKRPGIPVNPQISHSVYTDGVSTAICRVTTTHSSNSVKYVVIPGYTPDDLFGEFEQ